MTVYVVNKPTNHWDISPAAAYGKIVYLLVPDFSTDPAEMAATLEAGLHQYTTADFLLPVGNMAACCLAAAIAGRRGPVRLLRWHGTTGRYEAMPAL